MPCFCKLTEKLWLQSPAFYQCIGYYCASPKVIWKQLNITTLLRKRKSLSENAVFLIFHPINLFYTFASTKQVRTRCTSTGKPKAIFENNWPLALHYMKPNFIQKTPCFGKIPMEKVFPVVWAKWHFRCEALQRPKSKLKLMKGYFWSMEAQGCLKMLLCKYTSEGCSRALIFPNKLTYRSEFTTHIGK